MQYLFKNYLLRNYYIRKIEILFFLCLSFLLIFVLVNKTISILLYFQYFVVSGWKLAQIIFLDVISFMESLFSFCAMLAILIITKQFSKRSELTCYLASGISTNFIFFSIARFTLTLGIFSFFIVSFTRPIFFERKENIIAKIVHEAKFQFKEKSFNSIGNYFFYFQKKEKKKFYNLLLLKKNNPLEGQIIWAHRGEIKTSVAKGLFVFELENGKILDLFSNKENYRQTQFSFLLQPVQIRQTIQLENIETRVLKKQRNHTQFTFWDLLQESKKFSKVDKKEEQYFFIRAILLITRSLHNFALPLFALVLGFSYARFQPNFLYLKFFFLYVLYFFLVIQLEELTFEHKISVWYNFILPIATSLAAYYCFQKKV